MKKLFLLIFLIISPVIFYAQTINVGSFQDLSDALTNSQNASVTSSFDFRNTLSINRDTIITGVAKATLSEPTPIQAGSNAGRFRAFSVLEGATFNLSSITLEGFTERYGGAIYNEGTLELTRVTLQNNRAEHSAFPNHSNTGAGGAIYSTGDINITDSIIQNNTVGGNGGAIYTSGNLSISNTNFNNNIAQESAATGGAIYATGKELSVTGATFTHNQSLGSGGALFYNNSEGTFSIDDSTFEGNETSAASASGAGVFIGGGLGTITNVNFINNIASASGEQEGGYNTHFGLGAAIANLGNVTVRDSTFTGNSASTGGAVMNGSANSNSTAVMNIYKSTFSNNLARSGGAIVNYGTMNIYGSVVDGNIALDAGDRNVGGGILNYGTMYIENTEITNNIVGRGGGGIYTLGSITIDNVLFQGNSTDFTLGPAGTGDGFYNYNSTDIPSIIKNSTFIGDGIYNANGALIIENTSFTGNDGGTSGNGGVIFNDNYSPLTITQGSHFFDNKSGNGGIILHQSQGTLVIQDALFENNTASSNAGVIDSITVRNRDDYDLPPGAAMVIETTTFRNNSAVLQGGAIRSNGTTTIRDSLFDSNTAGSGGAISIHNGNYAGQLTVYNTDFLNNSAGSGGAISNRGGSFVTLFNSIISKNEASTGGAFMNYDSATFNVYDSVISSNVTTGTDVHACSGSINNEGNLIIQNSSIINNTHTNGSNGQSYGGGIFNTGTTTLIGDGGITKIEGNTSNGVSSGLYGEGGTINLKALNGGSIIINDASFLTYDARLSINEGGTTGLVEINNSVNTNPNRGTGSVNLYGGTLKFGATNVNGSSSHGTLGSDITFNAYGGTVSLIDNAITNTTNLGNLVLHNNIFYELDVNLENKTSDTFTTNSITANGNSIVISKLNFLGSTEYEDTEIKIAETNNYLSITEEAKYRYEPIYKFLAVDDSKLQSHGTLLFTNQNIGFNPAVQIASVVSLAGSYANSLFANEQSLSVYRNDLNDVSIQPFFHYDIFSLSNAAEVERIGYGVPTHFLIIDNSGSFSLTVDALYIGNYFYFEGISAFQNGAILGVSGEFFTNNFFISFGAHGGFDISNAKSMYGNEQFNNLSAGFVAALGYTFSFFDGFFELTPNVKASYTFLKTLDYSNAAGVSITSKPFHGITILPSIFIDYRFDETLIIGTSIQSSWNVQGSQSFSANDILLPEQSVEGFLEYGIYAEKKVDMLTGFLEIKGRNLSRTGISVQFGMDLDL